MELKNALAVCLISMFSATLVLLMARALDLQGASRLEPQLVRIVEQLEAIRKQGGIAVDPSKMRAADVLDADMLDDGLVVYYFHGNVRCVTCRSIESQSHNTVKTSFASELADGQVVWKTLNYEESSGQDLGEQFEVQVPVIVLARMNNGQLKEWRRLDRVWALVGDEAAFADYVETEIREMLTLAEPESGPGSESESDPETVGDVGEVPVPGDDAGDIPVPDETSDIPVPE